MELITAKAAVRQLKSEAGVVISQQRFGKLKKRGIFKTHRKPASRKDWFIFSEVLESYFSNVMPITSEQHEICNNYYDVDGDGIRSINELTAKSFSLDDFDVPDNLSKEFTDELLSANSTNLMLRDFAIDILTITPYAHDEIITALEDKYYCHDVMQDVLSAMIEDAAESIRV